MESEEIRKAKPDFGKEENLAEKVKEGNLNCHMSNLLNQSRDSNRCFSLEEAAGVLDGAELLHSFEKTPHDSRLEQLSSELSVDNRNAIPESALYRVAKSRGIPEEYMQKYLSLRYPSEKEKLEDVLKIGGKPSVDVIIKNYENRLLEALRRTFPSERFEAKAGIYLHFYHLTSEKTEVEKGFWRKRKVIEVVEKRESLCCIYKNMFNRLQIDCHNPLFLRACSETLNQLNAVFSKHIKINPTNIYYDTDFLAKE